MSGGWYGGNDCSSVFEVPRPKASPDHPTSKPVALIEAMVKNSSRSGDVVLDGFLGSGSTLIACERAGRRCFGLEIDPRYADVAVRRWEDLYGPERLRRHEGLGDPGRRVSRRPTTPSATTATCRQVGAQSTPPTPSTRSSASVSRGNRRATNRQQANAPLARGPAGAPTTPGPPGPPGTTRTSRFGGGRGGQVKSRGQRTRS